MTEEELYAHAAGIYANRVRNLERICKEKGIEFPEETDASAEECILSILNQLKAGKIQIVPCDYGFRAIKQ